ncbi:DUF3113 family protein, partial [Staphylococcus aureus]
MQHQAYINASVDIRI